MFEREFESVLKQYGNIIGEKKRFAGLIRDAFPDCKKEVRLILAAYETGIARQLQECGKVSNAFAYRFVKQLTDQYGLSRVNADWAVSVWCVCYGGHVLGKECDIRPQNGTGPAVADESGAGKKYGDLFRYRRCSRGGGLTVCGFDGDPDHTVIFQNSTEGKPVIEIGENILKGKSTEEVIITEGYRYIGPGAFSDNAKLHQVVMPYTLCEIGNSAFEKCSALKRVTLPERLEKIGDAAFRGSGLKTIVFPNALYEIGEAAFADCTDMDQITIPECVERVPGEMFAGCKSLKKIRLSEELKEIGDRAFAGCKELDIVTIPDSVRKIGSSAFERTNKMFIIQCSFGSYAESFARSHKIKYQLI